MFFSFDGIDGVGKSTQMELFLDWLREQDLSVTFCRDPGSTPLGERIREILLASEGHLAIDRRAEMLLYMAARAQLVDQVIRPALERGEVVISDRYLLANIVYQGHAGGLDPEVVRQVGEVAIGGLRPDCVFLLDMPVDQADRRLERPLDRMEQQGEAFRQRLRSGYLLEAERPGSCVQVIDAARSIEAVQTDIRQHAARFLSSPAD
jgi:dTMP kinase